MRIITHYFHDRHGSNKYAAKWIEKQIVGIPDDIPILVYGKRIYCSIYTFVHTSRVKHLHFDVCELHGYTA